MKCSFLLIPWTWTHPRDIWPFNEKKQLVISRYKSLESESPSSSVPGKALVIEQQHSLSALVCHLLHCLILRVSHAAHLSTLWLNWLQASLPGGPDTVLCSLRKSLHKVADGTNHEFWLSDLLVGWAWLGGSSLSPEPQVCQLLSCPPWMVGEPSPHPSPYPSID